MDGHRKAERRSLAYHRAIAGRLASEPALLAAARRRVDEWATIGSVHATYVNAWRELLGRPVDDAQQLLGDDGERMTALRQASPFAGALDPRTRWQIWRTVQ